MKWFCIEEIRGYPLLSIYPISDWTDLRQYGVEVNAEYSIVEHEKDTDHFYFVREKMDASSRHVLERLLKDPAWAEKYSSDLTRWNEEFFNFSGKLRKIDPKNFSSAQLLPVICEHLQLQHQGHAGGMVWNTLEFDKPLLSQHLQDYLKHRASTTGCKTRIPEAFSILTTPTEETFAQKEQQSLLAIAVEINRTPELAKLLCNASPQGREALKIISQFPTANTLVDKHTWEFCWLPYMYEGPAWGKEYFCEVVASIIRHNEDVNALLIKAQNATNEVKARQKQIAEQFGIDSHHQRFFAIARQIVYTKAFRKDALYHGLYCIEPFFKRAAKLLGISLRQLRCFEGHELIEALKTGKADADLLNQRNAYSAYYTDASKGKTTTSFLFGAKARQFMESLEFEEQKLDSGSVSELKGECACPGISRGPVRIIEQGSQNDKMRQGDVLVAHQTNPDVVPAMKKAAAVVTDLGGMTCHAAIISRELRIPCVIGTKIATKALKDGDLVEVDATHGTVRKIQ